MIVIKCVCVCVYVSMMIIMMMASNYKHNTFKMYCTKNATSFVFVPTLNAAVVAVAFLYNIFDHLLNQPGVLE